MDSNELYLMFRDQQRKLEAQETRIATLEHFIREKFPGDYAGDVGTITDLGLNPVTINYGEPAKELPKFGNVNPISERTEDATQ